MSVDGGEFPSKRAPPLTPEAFAALTDVSRETLDLLRRYAELLVKWNAKINLVGPATLPDLWRRHIIDSAQLAPLLPAAARVLIDLGSGAGLPGLILAILLRERGLAVHLIEADQRKGAFLREAARLTGIAVQIHACRFDAASSIAADVVTARAVAPLPTLLGHADRFLAPGGTCLFLKGGQSAGEVRDARAHWPIRVEEWPSRSDPSGVILQITREERAVRS